MSMDFNLLQQLNSRPAAGGAMGGVLFLRDSPGLRGTQGLGEKQVMTSLLGNQNGFMEKMFRALGNSFQSTPVSAFADMNTSGVSNGAFVGAPSFTPGGGGGSTIALD